MTDATISGNARVVHCQGGNLPQNMVPNTTSSTENCCAVYAGPYTTWRGAVSSLPNGRRDDVVAPANHASRDVTTNGTDTTDLHVDTSRAPAQSVTNKTNVTKTPFTTTDNGNVSTYNGTSLSTFARFASSGPKTIVNDSPNNGAKTTKIYGAKTAPDDGDVLTCNGTDTTTKTPSTTTDNGNVSSNNNNNPGIGFDEKITWEFFSTSTRATNNP